MSDYAQQSDQSHVLKVARARDLMSAWMVASGELLATIDAETDNNKRGMAR